MSMVYILILRALLCVALVSVKQGSTVLGTNVAFRKSNMYIRKVRGGLQLPFTGGK